MARRAPRPRTGRSPTPLGGGEIRPPRRPCGRTGRSIPGVAVRLPLAHALAGLALCTPGGASARPQDAPSAEARAFVEITAPREAWLVGEPMVLGLRFGFERELLDTELVPLFRRPLDVPVQVQASFLEELSGATALERAAGDERGMTFALGDGVAEARRVEDQDRGGRAYAVFEVERRYRPERTGELVVPGPLVRFAYATRFESDLLGEPIALDRRDAFVQGEPRMLRILPWPEEGRPPEFAGAVGSFTARAEAEPRELEVGQSLRLSVRIEGSGSLDHFEAPRLAELADFDLRGAIEERGANHRTFVYDVAPRSTDVANAPQVRFAFLDPGPPAAYRTVETEPIAITVRPARPVVAGVEGAGAASAEPGAPPERGPATITLFVAALAATGIAVLGILLARRRTARRRAAPGRARAADAAAAFRARAESEEDTAEAFVEFVAACLGSTTTAVITPDLPMQLVRAGIDAELALRSATFLDELVAARFGGAAPAGSRETARALVEELETALSRAEPS